MQELLGYSDVANCKYIGDENTWLDNYEITIDKQFEADTAEKYKIFIAKALMIGYGDSSIRLGGRHMFYVIGILRNEINSNGTKKPVRYKLIDTLSESILEITTNPLKHILSKCTTQVANATMQKGNIQVQSWVDKIGPVELRSNSMSTDKITEDSRCPFILLAEDKDKYKITDYNGNITKISFSALLNLISMKEIANCNTADNNNIMKASWTENYKILLNREFKKIIANKYEVFIAKSLMMGYGDVSFLYEIENQHVKIKKYTGSSNNIIIPSFITVIMEQAFRGIKIEALNINEGLRVIGNSAFDPMRTSKILENIEIPSTVELIGHEAFANNSKLFNSNGSFNTARLKLRNDKTIVLS